MTPAIATQQHLIALIPRLRRYARVLTGNMADADDVVQAALEKAMANLDKWQEGTSLDRWTLRIARNVWLDDRRRAHHRIAHDDITERHDLPGEDGDTVTQRRDQSQRVRHAVDGLPDQQRDLVGLVMLEGHSYREAAEILGLPIGTVMSRLSRAKAALARDLAEFSGDEGMHNAH